MAGRRPALRAGGCRERRSRNGIRIRYPGPVSRTSRPCTPDGGADDACTPTVSTATCQRASAPCCPRDAASFDKELKLLGTTTRGPCGEEAEEADGPRFPCSDAARYARPTCERRAADAGGLFVAVGDAGSAPAVVSSFSQGTGQKQVDDSCPQRTLVAQPPNGRDASARSGPSPSRRPRPVTLLESRIAWQSGLRVATRPNPRRASGGGRGRARAGEGRHPPLIRRKPSAMEWGRNGWTIPRSVGACRWRTEVDSGAT